MNRIDRIGSLCFALLFAAGNLGAQPLDSLGIKIGQMILIGFPDAKVDPIVLEEVRSGKVGTIILFEKNVPATFIELDKNATVTPGKKAKNKPLPSKVAVASFTPLKKIIWTYRQAAPIPLFVAIDEEGGKVNRLKAKYGFPRSISAQNMGRAGTLDSVRFYAESTAATLAGLGINVNLAPCVDVGVNKDNTVIYQNGRAYSGNADSVALLAAEFIKVHRRYGVLTVLKHFPGHGSSLADSHVGLTDVTHTWASSELIPYERLLSSGMVDGVMTAHIVNKTLDPSAYPGTMSRRMLDSLLRKSMHFNGVVYSDDMQMHAITKEYGVEEAIRLSVNAGVDILCFSNNIIGSEERTVTKVHTLIRGMVESGQIPRERIDQSFRRIMNLKSRIFHIP